MTRDILTTVLAAVAAVGVGAQAPTALQPGQRAELYKNNRAVIEKLVEKTVASSRSSTDPVKRAESYSDILVEFNRAINEARNKKDDGRVRDLTNHLNALLDKGLKPTLVSARKMVEGGSGEKEYHDARDSLLLQVDALLSLLSNDPAAKAALEQTRTSLYQEIRR